MSTHVQNKSMFSIYVSFYTMSYCSLVFLDNCKRINSIYSFFPQTSIWALGIRYLLYEYVQKNSIKGRRTGRPPWIRTRLSPSPCALSPLRIRART